MKDAALAIGLLLTTASQLRLPGVPVGPGELALLLWVVAVVVRVLLLESGPGAPGRSVMLGFWVVFALALSVGMVTAIATGEQFDASFVLHDTAAYALAAAVSCLCMMVPWSLRRVCWVLTIGGALSLSAQLLHAMGVLHVPGMDPWYGDRLRGWSDNPNQLVILCLVVALLAWHLAGTARTLIARLAALVLLTPALVAGRMSHSDTFLIALSGALPVWLVIRLLGWAHDERGGASLRAAAARLALLAAPLLLLATAPLIASRAGVIEALALRLAKSGGAEAAAEADLRMTLWHQALDRGIDSAMLGLGPGPHLQIPPAIVAMHTGSGQPMNVSHPTQNGTANYEAHDTVLDVLTQGGLLAVLSLLWLLLCAARNAYRARAAGLAALLAGVVVFMLTGNIARQPIFWFAIVLCLLAPRAVREPESHGMAMGRERRDAFMAYQRGSAAFSRSVRVSASVGC